MKLIIILISIKGLFELLDYLDENNYKKCIGTSSHMHYVDKTISGMKKIINLMEYVLVKWYKTINQNQIHFY